MHARHARLSYAQECTLFVLMSTKKNKKGTNCSARVILKVFEDRAAGDCLE
jgi:hypothetical protein